eukprot:6019100-Alexandrium_andersonii.AAC.1
MQQLGKCEARRHLPLQAPHPGARRRPEAHRQRAEGGSGHRRRNRPGDPAASRGRGSSAEACGRPDGRTGSSRSAR